LLVEQPGTSRCGGFLNAWLRFFTKDIRGLLPEGDWKSKFAM
jgi:hypothetical protein